MIAVDGNVNVTLDKAELEVLLSVLEEEVCGLRDDGDDPSETLVAVWRKVALLVAMSESSCQRGAARGGGSAAWQAMETERIRDEQRAAEHNRLPLDNGWAQ